MNNLYNIYEQISKQTIKNNHQPPTTYRQNNTNNTKKNNTKKNNNFYINNNKNKLTRNSKLTKNLITILFQWINENFLHGKLLEWCNDNKCQGAVRILYKKLNEPENKKELEKYIIPNSLKIFYSDAHWFLKAKLLNHIDVYIDPTFLQFFYGKITEKFIMVGTIQTIRKLIKYYQPDQYNVILSYFQATPNSPREPYENIDFKLDYKHN